jgi:outer membrane murein-binding lipoprotein Lpp
MQVAHLTWMSVVAVLLSGGCASRGNLEVLETELRRQEDQMTQLQQQLAATRSELDVAINEATQLRQQLAQNGNPASAPEHIANEFKAVGLRFNTYLTSGIDRDGQPGDEQISVLLYPHDVEGGLVKLSGKLELQALDLAAPKAEQEVGVWNYSAGDTKEAWHNGFLAAGFLFEESWQRPIRGPEITLHARFTTADGRQFDAIQPLRVTPPANRQVAVKSGSKKVLTAKPTIIPASHKRRDLPKPAEPDLPAAEIPAAGAAGAKVQPISTSDRFRDWEIPQYR